MPWIADSFEDIELIDAKSFALGAVRPIVRKPFGYLPSGKIIFGLGDTVMLNDPVAAQGSNTACRMAFHYYKAILDNKSQLFNEAWANETFEPFWESTAQYAQVLNTDFLKLRGFQLDAMVGFCKSPTMISDLVEGVNIPRNMYQWFGSSKTIQQKLAHYGVSKWTVIKGKMYLLRNIIAYILIRKLKFS